MTQAAREQFGNIPLVPVDAGLVAQDLPWSLENPVLYTLLWSLAIVAVFVPLSIREYRRAASK